MLALTCGIERSSASNLDAHCATQVILSPTSGTNHARSAQTATVKMEMNATPFNPSGADGGNIKQHSTLALLESLLLDLESEESDSSFEDQAIEEFANEIELAEIDDDSATVR